ncbi:MAG: hypothetical protein GY858_05025 [Candidatus Omnitrophica bacterium]|nr:hypothetical protein [Candidatus Omnitrophota bacterium]
MRKIILLAVLAFSFTCLAQDPSITIIEKHSTDSDVSKIDFETDLTPEEISNTYGFSTTKKSFYKTDKDFFSIIDKKGNNYYYRLVAFDDKSDSSQAKDTLLALGFEFYPSSKIVSIVNGENETGSYIVVSQETTDSLNNVDNYYQNIFSSSGWTTTKPTQKQKSQNLIGTCYANFSKNSQSIAMFIDETNAIRSIIFLVTETE